MKKQMIMLIVSSSAGSLGPGHSPRKVSIGQKTTRIDRYIHGSERAPDMDTTSFSFELDRNYYLRTRIRAGSALSV